ncbi:virion core protein [Equine molluscum contagiosum-like virus]|nr:virion core protein [Equine molluscum contagiosum-like virus]
MDIYVVKDGAYPRARARGDEVFFLLGEHAGFVDARLRELRARAPRAFLAEYAVTPDERTCALRARCVRASARVCGRPVSSAQFLRAPHAYALAPVPASLRRARDAGTLTVHVLCAPAGAQVRCLAFVHCPALLPLPEALAPPGTRVRDASFFYTDPRLVLALRGGDAPLRAAVFRNVALRAAVGRAVRGPEPSPLGELVAALLPPARAPARTALLRTHDADATRLARFCYDRDRFRAFVFAWFCGQLSALRAENEKIARAYEVVARTL